MLLPAKMTNRRQFLGRSALGAGSLLFGPLLLESCTDHLISPDPKPNPTPTHVPSAAFSIDPYDTAKTAIIKGLGFVPVVGDILDPLTGIFWPDSGQDIWGQVRAQVEGAVGQKLDDSVYTNAKGKFDGLHALIQDYLIAIKDGDPGNVQTKWASAHDEFFSNGTQSLFMVPGYEVLLLPFFTQFTNLLLALLRDAAAHGIDWGFDPLFVGLAAQQIKDYTVYAHEYNMKWVIYGKTYVVKNTERDDLNAEPFKTVNRYDREMTLTVLDYMDTWPYYDIIKYPHGAHNPDTTPINLFTREIYSDPYGNMNEGLIELPSPATQFPTQLTVWGGADHGNDYHILAVQLTYPAGGGPRGITQMPRMGVQDGGTNQPPYGGTFSLDNNPINAVLVSYERESYVDYDVIDTLRFGFLDKTRSHQMGQQGGGGQFNSGVINYPNWALSSIYIHGSAFITINNYAADCIVFGFMRLPPV